MKRSSKIIIGAVLTLGIAGGVAAYGKHHFSDPTRFAGYMVEHVSDELELTDVQTLSLQGLADEVVKVKSQMKSEMKNDRQTLRDMVAAPNFDQGKALQLLNEKTTAIKDNAPTVVAALGKFLDGLTAEQKAEILERMDQHRHQHRLKNSDRDHDHERGGKHSN